MPMIVVDPEGLGELSSVYDVAAGEYTEMGYELVGYDGCNMPDDLAFEWSDVRGEAQVLAWGLADAYSYESGDLSTRAGWADDTTSLYDVGVDLFGAGYELTWSDSSDDTGWGEGGTGAAEYLDTAGTAYASFAAYEQPDPGSFVLGGPEGGDFTTQDPSWTAIGAADVPSAPASWSPGELESISIGGMDFGNAGAASGTVSLGGLGSMFAQFDAPSTADVGGDYYRQIGAYVARAAEAPDPYAFQWDVLMGSHGGVSSGTDLDPAGLGMWYFKTGVGLQGNWSL